MTQNSLSVSHCLSIPRQISPPAHLGALSAQQSFLIHIIFCINHCPTLLKGRVLHSDYQFEYTQ